MLNETDIAPPSYMPSWINGVRSTSFHVYHQIKDEGLLSERRWQIYDALWQLDKPSSANEVHRYIIKQPRFQLANMNVITRLGELRDSGAVAEIGEFPCSVNSNVVTFFEITGKLPRSFVKPEGRVQRLRRQHRILAECLEMFCTKTEALPSIKPETAALLEKSRAILKEIEDEKQ